MSDPQAAKDAHSEFRASGLGHMRARRGPSPKWKKHYGERGTAFYEAGNQVQLIPTRRAIDFLLKHHLRIGEMLREGVLFKDIWRVAGETKGFDVPYSTFYAVLRRFADFLDVPRKRDRKRLLDEELKRFAERLARKDTPARSRGPEIVVEAEPTRSSPSAEGKGTMTEAQQRRRELLSQGRSMSELHNEQLAAAISKKS